MLPQRATSPVHLFLRTRELPRLQLRICGDAFSRQSRSRSIEYSARLFIKAIRPSNANIARPARLKVYARRDKRELEPASGVRKIAGRTGWAASDEGWEWRQRRRAANLKGTIGCSRWQAISDGTAAKELGDERLFAWQMNNRNVKHLCVELLLAYTICNESTRSKVLDGVKSSWDSSLQVCSEFYSSKFLDWREIVVNTIMFPGTFLFDQTVENNFVSSQ